MSNENSLTGIYHELRNGDENAANQLFQACIERLTTYAKKHLEGVSQKMAEGEDVSLSALNSFIKAAKSGRFPNFKDRDDLWRLLFTFTKHKAIDLRRYESRRKVSGESGFTTPANQSAGIHDIPADLSEEVFAVLIGETLEDHLAMLKPELCEFAIAKLEGFTNLEISQKFGFKLRTVERKLRLIRLIWEDHSQSKSP